MAGKSSSGSKGKSAQPKSKKTAVKAGAKTVSKMTVKSAGKSSSKSSSKVSEKVTPKAASKTVAKPVVKADQKKTSKVGGKTAGKTNDKGLKLHPSAAVSPKVAQIAPQKMSASTSGSAGKKEAKRQAAKQQPAKKAGALEIEFEEIDDSGSEDFAKDLAEDLAKDLGDDMSETEGAVDALNPMMADSDAVAEVDPSALRRAAMSLKGPAEAEKVAQEKKKKKDELKIDRNGDLEAQWSQLKEKTKAIKPIPYKMTERYEARVPIQHKLMGWGYILTNQNDRLEVLFQEGIKFLISNYKT